MDQFSCHHSAADLGKRIGALHLLGIYHRICGRQKIMPFPPVFFKGHLMVVCHDHGHALLLGKPYLRCCCNPIIAGQDRICAVFLCILDQTVI